MFLWTILIMEFYYFEIYPKEKLRLILCYKINDIFNIQTFVNSELRYEIFINVD